MKALVVKMLEDANKLEHQSKQQVAIRRAAYALWQQHINK